MSTLKLIKKNYKPAKDGIDADFIGRSRGRGIPTLQGEVCRQESVYAQSENNIADSVVIGRAHGRGIQALEVPAPQSAANVAISISRTLVQIGECFLEKKPTLFLIKVFFSYAIENEKGGTDKFSLKLI